MRGMILILFLGFSLIYTACNRSPVLYETPRETVNSDIEELDASDITFSGSDNQDAVTGDFTLPTTSESGNPVTWTSSDPDHVTITDGDADVTRPGFFEGDVSVTLTGTVTVGDASGTTEIVVLVAASTTVNEFIKKASNRASDDYFGVSVSVSGDTAIVGAYAEDDLYLNSGAAYIFERNESGIWNETALLRASDGQADDQFGTSVSISGNYAIIGASWADDTLNSYTDNGAAYIFERDGSGNWIEKAKLQASDRISNDFFGISVAISGNCAVAGAYQEDGGDTNSGSVYFFERDSGGNWIERAKRWASNANPNDEFGISVSLSGNYAIVGARYEDGDGDLVSDGGAAYIFERNESGDWKEVAILRASDTQAFDYFGWSVSISGDRAIVGSIYENGGFGNPYNNSGAAYVFERDMDGIWNEAAVLRASDAQDDDNFGGSVAIDGDYVLVGAYAESGGPGDLLPGSGSVYIFKRDRSGTWYENRIVRASNAGNGDYFGVSVSLNGGSAFAGAIGEDGSGTPSELNSGAVYILY